jgi:hypothetical protein
MGARVFIQTKTPIIETELLKKHGLTATVANPTLYLFHDEYHEEQFGRFTLPERSDENGAAIFRRPEEYYLDTILDLSTWSDERIAHHIDVMWVREGQFWKEYKAMITGYVQAKRDYLKAMVDAGIQAIFVLAPLIPMPESERADLLRPGTMALWPQAYPIPAGWHDFRDGLGERTYTIEGVQMSPIIRGAYP